MFRLTIRPESTQGPWSGGPEPGYRLWYHVLFCAAGVDAELDNARNARST
jgi:hypothetical protein